MKRFTFALITFILLLSGCSKAHKMEINSNSLRLELYDSDEETLNNSSTNLLLTDKKIVILFGYGFSQEDYDKALSFLDAKYGLDSENGIIYPVLYPSDFKRGSRGYVSEFTDLLTQKDLDIAGLILISAPENSHKVLARNQDFWNENVPYPVIALFPQDDNLGLESTCDIVIENGQSAKLNGDMLSENEESLELPEILQNLTATIDYILETRSPFTKDGSLITHAGQMLKTEQIHKYTDPETGLHSINHFIIN